ncbi:hypothetical protein [Geothrix sp. 21YS21S-2]|uniref:hypothetical protein n=1 Tax=Geothrix sp. 21YS21S-2 TaxID=3068893 RepID=UPI0027BAB7FE|nr:hypothetical protein [Geothrix sp. 21YS21S-2]
MNLRLLLVPALLVVQPLLATNPPGYDVEADLRAQAWLDKLQEEALAQGLATLQAARKGPVPVGAQARAQECLVQVVGSMAAVHPDALSYPGSQVAFSYHAVIQPRLAENGFPGWQDLGATLVALGWMKAPQASVRSSSSTGSSSSSTTTLPATPSASPAKAPATPAPAARTLATEGLTFQEATALIAALNPMLPDGTYDVPALNARLATVASHDLALAANLMGHYRLEQARLKAAITR